MTLAFLAGFSAFSPAQERFRRTPPIPDALQELRLPPVESITLSNGLSLALAREPLAPLITLQLVIWAGERDSPGQLPGVAALTARMVGKGARLLTSDSIESMLESMGAEFFSSVSMDYTVLTMRFMEPYLDRALSLLRAMILEADFQGQEFSAVRRTYYYELRGRRNDPESVGRWHLLRLLFANHPYRTGVYSEDVLKFVTIRDVSSFFSRFYRPKNAVLVATGNIDAPTLVRGVSQRFSAWAGGAPERTPPPSPAPNDRDRVCFVIQPASDEAVLVVGNLVMPPTSPDYFSFQVLNQVLGGTTGNRLFMNLREKKGYAYYAFSEAEFFRSCGVFWARARVNPREVFPAVQEILRECRRLATERADPSEIEEAKSFLIGNMPLRLESPEDFSATLARVVALGLGDGHWNEATENLMLVNAERSLDVAQRSIGRRPIVVIVGKTDWIEEFLRDFDAIEVYDGNGVFIETIRKGKVP